MLHEYDLQTVSVNRLCRLLKVTFAITYQLFYLAAFYCLLFYPRRQIACSSQSNQSDQTDPFLLFTFRYAIFAFPIQDAGLLRISFPFFPRTFSLCVVLFPLTNEPLRYMVVGPCENYGIKKPCH